MKTQTLSIIFLAVTLSACGGMSSKPNHSNTTSKKSETRLFVGGCTHDVFAQQKSGLTEVIGLSLASSAVSKGFDALSNALKKMGEDKVNKTTLIKNIGHEGLNGIPQCIQVVRGEFKAPEEGDNVVLSDGPGSTDYALKGEASLFSEILLIPSKDGTAVLFQPLKVEYDGNVPGGKSSQSPSLAISVGFATADKEAHKGGYGVRLINFEKKANGKTIDFLKDGRLDTANQSQWLNYTIKGDAPYSVVVDVIETKKCIFRPIVNTHSCRT